MSEIPLGNNVEYKKNYAPDVLFPIARETSRRNLKITNSFYGFDIWNCYEISWLNARSKPEVRILEIYVPSDSKNLVESKSLKLYLFSLNNEKFDSEEKLSAIIKNDLEKVLGSEITLKFRKMDFFKNKKLSEFEAESIDYIESNFENLEPTKNHLKTDDTKIVHEKLYSDLHKTNCLITSQPDWATIFVEYKGAKIIHESLLKYIVSFRDEDMFHEHSVEKIFEDIKTTCKPDFLTVYARYTRRGGIDINPIRSTEKIENIEELNLRLPRQ